MVTIKFFAVFKSKLGREEIQLNLAEPMALGRVIDKIKAEQPEVAKILAEINPMIAVNQEFANLETLVKDGDEIAFIPPVSGGETEMIRIQSKDFSIDEEVRRVKDSSKRIGGIVTFLGVGREFSRGKDIKWLEFEHYPGMAENKLKEIRATALEKFDILEVGIVHRTGKIEIGENIVFIIVAAEHRKDAFRACEWCIDELKQIVPIWKKEITTEGEVWVEEHP